MKSSIIYISIHCHFGWWDPKFCGSNRLKDYLWSYQSFFLSSTLHGFCIYNHTWVFHQLWAILALWTSLFILSTNRVQLCISIYSTLPFYQVFTFKITVFLFEYILKCYLFLWRQNWISALFLQSSLSPDFIPVRNHSNMLISCSRDVTY